MITIDEQLKIVRDHQHRAPVETVKIAEALGLTVYKAKQWDREAVSGMIIADSERGGASGCAIFVNAKHPETRRRFTIAHEIAHYILHREYIGDGIYDDGLYRSNLQSHFETAANQLAARILMPAHLLKRDAAQLGYVSNEYKIDTLSEMYNVSRESMTYRLTNLGLLKIPIPA